MDIPRKIWADPHLEIIKMKIFETQKQFLKLIGL